MRTLIDPPDAQVRALAALCDRVKREAVAEYLERRAVKSSDVSASAQVEAMLLVTRDTKGFPPGDPGVRMPYHV